MDYKILKEIRTTSGWSDSVKKSYSIAVTGEFDNLFIINSKNTYLCGEDVRRVIDYSQKSDNRIVPVYEMGDKIITEYLEDYAPLVPLGYSTFRNIEELQRRGGEYRRLMWDESWVSCFCKRVQREFMMFNRVTGCHFSDISANNIMVKENMWDFYIVDIQSVYRMEEDDEPHVPFSQILLPNSYPTNDNMVGWYAHLDEEMYEDEKVRVKKIEGSNRVGE